MRLTKCEDHFYLTSSLSLDPFDDPGINGKKIRVIKILFDSKTTRAVVQFIC